MASTSAPNLKVCLPCQVAGGRKRLAIPWIRWARDRLLSKNPPLLPSGRSTEAAALRGVESLRNSANAMPVSSRTLLAKYAESFKLARYSSWCWSVVLGGGEKIESPTRSSFSWLIRKLPVRMLEDVRLTCALLRLSTRHNGFWLAPLGRSRSTLVSYSPSMPSNHHARLFTSGPEKTRRGVTFSKVITLGIERTGVDLVAETREWGAAMPV